MLTIDIKGDRDFLLEFAARGGAAAALVGQAASVELRLDPAFMLAVLAHFEEEQWMNAVKDDGFDLQGRRWVKAAHPNGGYHRTVVAVDGQPQVLHRACRGHIHEGRWDAIPLELAGNRDFFLGMAAPRPNRGLCSRDVRPRRQRRARLTFVRMSGVYAVAGGGGRAGSAGRSSECPFFFFFFFFLRIASLCGQSSSLSLPRR